MKRTKTTTKKTSKSTKIKITTKKDNKNESSINKHNDNKENNNDPDPAMTRNRRTDLGVQFVTSVQFHTPAICYRRIWVHNL